jgi:hypothetical protein
MAGVCAKTERNELASQLRRRLPASTRGWTQTATTTANPPDLDPNTPSSLSRSCTGDITGTLASPCWPDRWAAASCAYQSNRVSSSDPPLHSSPHARKTSPHVPSSSPPSATMPRQVDREKRWVSHPNPSNAQQNDKPNRSPKTTLQSSW